MSLKLEYDYLKPLTVTKIEDIHRILKKELDVERNPFTTKHIFQSGFIPINDSIIKLVNDYIYGENNKC